jgi:hypothetical protein
MKWSAARYASILLLLLDDTDTACDGAALLPQHSSCILVCLHPSTSVAVSLTLLFPSWKHSSCLLEGGKQRVGWLRSCGVLNMMLVWQLFPEPLGPI